MIELATGIHASKYLVSGGAYIVICDHFLDYYKKYKKNAKVQPTAYGVQLSIDDPLVTKGGTENIKDAMKR